MSAKSRSNYKIGMCLKDCANKGAMCNKCIRFSQYKQREKE